MSIDLDVSSTIWLRVSVHRVRLDDSQIQTALELYSPKSWAFTYEESKTKSKPHYHMWFAEPSGTNHSRAKLVREWLKSLGMSGNADYSLVQSDNRLPDRIRLYAYCLKGIYLREYGLEEEIRTQGNKRADDLKIKLDTTFNDCCKYVTEAYKKEYIDRLMSPEFRRIPDNRRYEYITTQIVCYYEENSIPIRFNQLKILKDTLCLRLHKNYRLNLIRMLCPEADH